MTDGKLFYIHQWDDRAYGWSVHEVPGGGRTEPISVITWLTKQQAIAIADCLNDAAGFNWHERHPDWFEEMKSQKEIDDRRVKQWWERRLKL